MIAHKRASRAWRLALGLLLAACAGCLEPIDSTYGVRSGAASQSVNGTAVLAEMFADRGHQVSSWRWLSPKLDQAQTIVWFPDDFYPPTDPVREWLENWLLAQPQRTLIYVGRDYSAAPGYWQWLEDQGQAENRVEVRRHLIEARYVWDALRMNAPAAADCPWFRVEALPVAMPITPGEGTAAWTAEIDAGKCEIELHTRMEPSEWATPWLWSGDEVLVSREPFEESQLVLVANGSFLLNLPLVNPEHRKLAGRLIDSVGPPGRVVFLESGQAGPPISQRDPSAETSGLDLLGVWPLSAVLVQIAVAAMVLMAWRYPIFGRPREANETYPHDFGRHIQAVGALLERTGDAQYARSRIEHYLRTVRGEIKPLGPADGGQPGLLSPFRESPAAASVATVPASDTGLPGP